MIQTYNYNCLFIFDNRDAVTVGSVARTSLSINVRAYVRVHLHDAISVALSKSEEKGAENKEG